jgi:hypothetical protein
VPKASSYLPSEFTLKLGSKVLLLHRMDLSGYLKMDPHLLVGVVNTTLRNHCSSLEDLCATYAIDRAALVQRLASAGYEFRAEQQQFR